MGVHGRGGGATEAIRIELVVQPGGGRGGAAGGEHVEGTYRLDEGGLVARFAEVGAGLGLVEFGDDDAGFGMEEAAVGSGDGFGVERGFGVVVSRGAKVGEDAEFGEHCGDESEAGRWVVGRWGSGGVGRGSGEPAAHDDADG